MKVVLPDSKELAKLYSHDDWKEDALWAYISGNSLIRRVYVKRLQTIIDTVPQGKYESILDIGTGTGILIPTLFKIGRNVYGIDINKSLVYVRKMLQKRDLRPNLMIGDVRNLPYRDGQFDLIICSSVLEHLDKRDLFKSVDEIRRVLIDDGYLIVGYPIETFIVKLFFKSVDIKSEEHHFSPYYEILNVVASKLKVLKRRRLPASFLPYPMSIYEVLLCRKS